MANIRPWTSEDVLAFVLFVREQGGDVKLPARSLRDGGVEATIVPPLNAPAGWATKTLHDFDRTRK